MILHPIRESRVWQEACAEGDSKRLKKVVETIVRKGMTLEEIADLLDIPVDEIRHAANDLQHVAELK